MQTSGASSTPTTTSTTVPTVRVVYTVGTDRSPYGNGCEDNGGYDDIDSGVPATVQDGHGTILGAGVLEATTSDANSCNYEASFTVRPSTDGIYRATAGNDNRGFLNRTDADVHFGVLHLDAYIGDNG
jgi:hypothetical protein